MTKLLTVLAVAISLFSAQLPPKVGALTIERQLQQRDLHTYQDYKELEQLLVTAYDMGDPKAAYSLGLLYSNEFEFPSKNVAPNYKKAQKYFQEAMRRGVPLAAYNLALLFVINNEKSRALNVLRKGLESKVPTDVEVILASTFATIVLDHFHDDKEAIDDAIRYLSDTLKKRKLATMEYLLANLYHVQGNEQLANRYLTLACTNPNAPGELLQICFHSDNIEVIKRGEGDKEDASACSRK